MQPRQWARAFLIGQPHDQVRMRRRAACADAAPREIAGAVAHARVGAPFRRAQPRANADAVAREDAPERCRAGSGVALAQLDPRRNASRLAGRGDRVRDFDLDTAVPVCRGHDGRVEARFERRCGPGLRGRLEPRRERERTGAAAQRQREQRDDRVPATRRERERHGAETREQRSPRADPTAVGREDAERLRDDQSNQEGDGANPARDRGVAKRIVRNARSKGAPRSQVCQELDSGQKRASRQGIAMRRAADFRQPCQSLCQ